MSTRPAEPWLSNKRWRGGRVTDHPFAAALGFWIATLLAALASGLILRALPKAPALRPPFPALIAIALSLVTLLFLALALQRTARWLRFGVSTFEMATFPGVIGGQLVGIVYTRVKLHPHQGIDIALLCIKRITTGFGNNQHTSDVVVWHDEQHLLHTAQEQDLSRTAIPIAFTIPRHCEPTFDAAGYSEVLWKLQVRAKLDGVDYESSFPVPVYVTQDSKAAPPKVDPLAPYRAPEVPKVSVTERGVRFWKDAAGAIHVHTRPGRHPGTSAALALTAAIFSAATLFLFHTATLHGFFGLLPGIMAIPFTLISLLLWTTAFAGLFKSTTVTVDSRNLQLTTRFLLWTKTRRLRADRIRAFTIDRSMSQGAKEWFSIHLHTAAGKSLCAVPDLPKPDAAWLVEQMQTTLRLVPVPSLAAS